MENAQEQEKLAQIITEQGLSARAVEEIVKKIKNGEEITFENDAEQTKKAKGTRKNKKTEISIYCRDFQNRLIELLGTKVKIVPKNWSSSQSRTKLKEKNLQFNMFMRVKR